MQEQDIDEKDKQDLKKKYFLLNLLELFLENDDYDLNLQTLMMVFQNYSQGKKTMKFVKLIQMIGDN